MNHYYNFSKCYYEDYFIDDQKRDLIVISPGGGYDHTSVRESDPVKDFYNLNGFHVVIVHYTEEHLTYPYPQEVLSGVIKLYQNDYRVNHIIGLGFSAGGHNILEVALHPDIYGVKFDLLMLAYPVVTSDKKYAHIGSFKALLGDKFEDEKLLKRLSLENEVTKSAPPLFLWGTWTDESVDVMNSIKLLEAYKKNGLNVEYHVYPMGGHGLSLANEKTCGGDPKKVIPYVSGWSLESIKWLEYNLNKME